MSDDKLKSGSKLGLILVLIVVSFLAGVYVGVKNPAYIWACITAEVA